jgi:hypothetical protein
MKQEDRSVQHNRTTGLFLILSTRTNSQERHRKRKPQKPKRALRAKVPQEKFFCLMTSIFALQTKCGEQACIIDRSCGLGTVAGLVAARACVRDRARRTRVQHAPLRTCFMLSMSTLSTARKMSPCERWYWNKKGRVPRCESVRTEM